MIMQVRENTKYLYLCKSYITSISTIRLHDDGIFIIKVYRLV